MRGIVLKLRELIDNSRNIRNKKSTARQSLRKQEGEFLWKTKEALTRSAVG